MFEPVLARVLPDYDKFAFYTADLDNNDLVLFFEETNTATNPQLLLWKEGQAIKRIIGALSDARLREHLDAWKEIVEVDK